MNVKSIIVALCVMAVPFAVAEQRRDQCSATKISRERAKEVAVREMERLLQRKGDHDYVVKNTKEGWTVHVDEKPVGPGRHKTIHIDRCGTVLRVDGGR
jgi:hypothetical protein